MLKIYQVLTKFDSAKNYGFDIRPQYGRCLSVMKKGDKFDSNQFVKDHRNEFTLRRNTLEANLAVIHKAITIGKRIGMLKEIPSDSTPILYSDFCKLETVSYFRSQLRGSNRKNTKSGTLEIEPIHVDHSIPGAYGFIIHTSEGPIVYTGDLRRHGAKPQMTEEFIQKAKDVKPIALIAEGTRIKDVPTNENEQLVYDQSNQLINKSKNLIFADFNFKDVDRVKTFYNLAKSNGRKLVVKIKDCYFLKHLASDPNLNLPNWNDENIVVYKAKYRSGTYSDSDYYGDDRLFATATNALTASEIAMHPEKYLCALGFFSFNALIDMKPKSGAIYIHSASEAYNEEQVLSTKRLHNWLDKFQMEHHQIHCSGHAKGEDLMSMVKEIDAKILFPIHTEYPTEYVRVTNKITIVELNKKYNVTN